MNNSDIQGEEELPQPRKGRAMTVAEEVIEAADAQTKKIKEDLVEQQRIQGVSYKKKMLATFIISVVFYLIFFLYIAFREH